MSASNFHSLPIELYIAGEAIEIIAEIEYTISAGSPAHMGDLSYPGHPAEPAEIEVGKVELVVIDKTVSPPQEVRQEAPAWLTNYIANSQAAYETLGEASDWGEYQGPDPDDWYDARFEREETARQDALMSDENA